jgi:N-carbamoylputrescine amidase
MAESMTVALISDVFHEADAEARLRDRLRDAKNRGAELAVLPEIAMNPWSPATKTLREDDAEEPGGPRHLIQSRAARDIGIGVIGAAIVTDPTSSERHNTTLVFNHAGELVSTYEKLHIPEEPGFWETSHYVAGERPPHRIDGFPMPIGAQICSDNNRPEGCHLLGAQGVEVILNPRASSRSTYQLWRPIWIANALTSRCFVLSVNRPRAEQGVELGGASIAIAPDGDVLLETTETVSVVTLDRERIIKARTDYPGYLEVRADLYAKGWAQIAETVYA